MFEVRHIANRDLPFVVIETETNGIIGEFASQEGADDFAAYCSDQRLCDFIFAVENSLSLDA